MSDKTGEGIGTPFDPLDALLLALRHELTELMQRTGELTELQRQDTLARLLTVAYLLRAPVIEGLRFERTLDGRAFLR